MPELYAGVLFFPWERSAEVLHAWHEWTETVPEETTSVGRILQFPPLPDVPASRCAAARSRSSRPSTSAARRRAREHPAPAARARPGARHLRDDRRRSGSAEIHMDPTRPAALRRPTTSCSASSRPRRSTPSSTRSARARARPLVSVEIRHLGGAMGRAQPHARRARDDARRVPALRRRRDADDEPAERRVRSAPRRHAASRSRARLGAVLQFHRAARRPGAGSSAEDTYRRLQAVKRAIDPARSLPRQPLDPAGGRGHRARPPPPACARDHQLAHDRHRRTVGETCRGDRRRSRRARAAGTAASSASATASRCGRAGSAGSRTARRHDRSRRRYRVEPGAAEDGAWLTIATQLQRDRRDAPAFGSSMPGRWSARSPRRSPTAPRAPSSATPNATTSRRPFTPAGLAPRRQTAT